MKAIIGRKIGMTELFDEASGSAVAVTVIEAGPCTVLGAKTVESDGYAATLLAYGDVSAPSKAHAGVFAARKLEPRKLIREFRGPLLEGAEVGGSLKATVFEIGDVVDVIGKTKGRGTTGVMKRWNFHGAPASHGTEKRHRTPGSIGSNTDPGRTWPGKKLAGRYGDERVTVPNLRVVQVDGENNLIAVSGAIPGPRSGVVIIRSASKSGAGRPAAKKG